MAGASLPRAISGEVPNQFQLGYSRSLTRGTGSTKVVYIAGSSRSGSTLLDRLLGSLQGVASLGEVRVLFSRGARRRCGCGERAHNCEFWSSILTATQERSGLDLSAMVEAWRREGHHRYVPRATHYLRSSRRSGAQAVQEPRWCYGRVLADLYESVIEHTGASTVVDSSKYAIEALLAGSAPGVDMRVVHLVRDPRGVAHSWAQRKTLPQGNTMAIVGPARVAQRWMLDNIEAEIFLRRAFGDRYRLLRYEDLVANPHDVLEDLARWAELEAAVLPFVGANEVELTTAHTAGGNPDRFSAGVVSVRSDQRWMRTMRPFDRVVATLLCFPMIVRYGYPVVPW